MEREFNTSKQDFSLYQEHLKLPEMINLVRVAIAKRDPKQRKETLLVLLRTGGLKYFPDYYVELHMPGGTQASTEHHVDWSFEEW